MFDINATLGKSRAENMNPVVLAFIGDAVFTLYVREKITFSSDFKAGEAHRLASREVNARAQAALAVKLLPLLTEEEERVFRRARNAKKTSSAKNYSVSDYNKATGLEALVGYLYITGNRDRLNALLAAGYAETENSPATAPDKAPATIAPQKAPEKETAPDKPTATSPQKAPTSTIQTTKANTATDTNEEKP